MKAESFAVECLSILKPCKNMYKVLYPVTVAASQKFTRFMLSILNPCKKIQTGLIFWYPV